MKKPKKPSERTGGRRERVAAPKGVKQKPGGRLANYRSGDRAEALGIVLLQAFCAVAPVPRQEDFGLVDAVATLLRRDGHLLYAEASFSVQFKSRTEKVIEYLGARFEALMQQELALFIGQVDLTAAEIALYNVAAVLTHPNVNEMKGLVVHLEPQQEEQLEEGILHTSLGDPVLKWTTAMLADRDFETLAYSVMKKWLALEQWNRRYRKMGLQIEILWATNEMPSQGGKHFLWNPQRAVETLGEVVPAIQVIAGLAISDESLLEPALKLTDWLRARGIEADPSRTLGSMAIMQADQKLLGTILEKHPASDIAVRLILISNKPDDLEFVFLWAERKRSGMRKYSRTIEQVRALGFDVELDPDLELVTTVGLGAKWLKKRKYDLVEVIDGVYLLRKEK